MAPPAAASAALGLRLLLLQLLWGASALDDGLARTPPLGYRTWNDVHGNVNTTYIMRMVDAITSKKRLVDGEPTSLLNLGFGRVGLDDGWQACGTGWAPPGRTPSFHAKDGTPLINGSLFPSLKEMVDYGHARGVLMDMYVLNCICLDEYTLQADAGFAQRAYAGDAAMLLAAGFDGVKIDNCGDDRGAGFVARARHLNASGRRLLIENSNQGFGNPWPSGTPHQNPPGPPRENPPNRSVLPDYCPFHMFRSGGDIGPSFGDIYAKLQYVRPYLATTRPVSRPGCWAFPDMLEVGNFDGPLAFVESRTHFGAWCVVSSPLLLSTALADDATLDAIWPIVSNREAVGVNQMWHGHPGRLVLEGAGAGGGAWQCWAKAGPNGSQAGPPYS
jgi:alpha-galactosidase